MRASLTVADVAFERVWMRVSNATPTQASLLAATLKSIYSEPGRSFHNWSHICFVANQIMLFVAMGGVEQSVIDEAIIAAAFHDVVYRLGDSDNEKQSELWFRTWATSFGVSDVSKDNVSKAILETKDHKPSSPAGILLSDADMSVLATDWPVFLDYCDAIRAEYNHFVGGPEEDFMAKNKAFYQSVLGGVIFTTAMFRDLYDAKARGNLRRILKERHGIGGE